MSQYYVPHSRGCRNCSDLGLGEEGESQGAKNQTISFGKFPKILWKPISQLDHRYLQTFLSICESPRPAHPAECSIHLNGWMWGNKGWDWCSGDRNTRYMTSSEGGRQLVIKSKCWQCVSTPQCSPLPFTDWAISLCNNIICCTRYLTPGIISWYSSPNTKIDIPCQDILPCLLYVRQYCAWT